MSVPGPPRPTIHASRLRTHRGDGDHPRGPANADSADAERPVAPVESLSGLARSRHMWLLIGMFAICGFQDFFVSTHVVAFAIDHNVSDLLAGNVLALMGLMALAGVMLSGYLSDLYGPAVPSVLCFLVRIAIFAFIMTSQTTPSIVAFALLYGSTFLITAPLAVIFAGQIFGRRHLGTVTGIVSMIHQVAGGVGAYVGARFFDHFGSYDRAFAVALGMALAATVLSALLHQRRRPPDGVREERTIRLAGRHP